MSIFRIQYDENIKPVDILTDLAWQDHPFVQQLRVWLDDVDGLPVPLFPVPSEMDPRPISHATDDCVGHIPDVFWTTDIPRVLAGGHWVYAQDLAHGWRLAVHGAPAIHVPL